MNKAIEQQAGRFAQAVTDPNTGNAYKAFIGTTFTLIRIGARLTWMGMLWAFVGLAAITVKAVSAWATYRIWYAKYAHKENTNLAIEAIKVIARVARGKAIEIHGYARERILGCHAQVVAIEPVEEQHTPDRSNMTFAELAAS